MFLLILSACTQPTPTDALDVDTGRIHDPVDTGFPDRDEDEDGYLRNADGDCNDFDPTIHPDAPELCDQVDNDCDGDVDEHPGPGPFLLFPDLDGDGFGSAPAQPAHVSLCPLERGWSIRSTDCDDTDPNRFPANPDTTCNGIDENCDGLPDDDVPGTTWWYTDTDGDGFHGEGRFGCWGGDYESRHNTDCDETRTDVNMGATEIWFDGIDQNCDGNDDQPPDTDGDGFHDLEDCDNQAISVHPGAEEACGNGIDDNCNGVVDDDCIPYPSTPSSGCAHRPRLNLGELLHRR